MDRCFTVQYAVPPGYHFLIAELYYGDEHWAEINTEHMQPRVLIFSRPCGEPWNISLADAIDALRRAEAELRKRSVFFEPDYE